MDTPIISEEWRPINGLPHYEVSNLGRVRSLPRIIDVRGGPGGPHKRRVKGGLLKPCHTNAGYQIVGTTHENAYHVHILVCEAFHGPRPSPDYEVGHRDGTRTNNVESNLRWVTKIENMADRDLHGRTRRGEVNNKAKLTADEVREIRNRFSRGESLNFLGECYGVMPSNIRFIVDRHTWKHV